MKDVKNLLQTKVHEVYENNTHDFFIIKGQSGDEKDDQIVNANCKIVYFTQYMKQVCDWFFNTSPEKYGHLKTSLEIIKII